jgi:hypothetical protein
MFSLKEWGMGGACSRKLSEIEVPTFPVSPRVRCCYVLCSSESALLPVRLVVGARARRS